MKKNSESRRWKYHKPIKTARERERKTQPPPLPAPAEDVVTDHALLRWLERVHGLEIEWMRAQLRAEVAALAASGVRQFRTAHGIYIFSPKRRLVTVLPPDAATSPVPEPCSR